MQGVTGVETSPATPVQLGQINVMRSIATLDSPLMRGFADLLDPIHDLAERSAGFVWRLPADDSATSGMPAFADGTLLLNYSIWQSLQDLWNFTYASQHLDLLRRRREWNERIVESSIALWWIPAGTIPTLDEALERLELLRSEGPTPHAFTFRQSFPPPTAIRAGSPGEAASLATGTAKRGG